MPEQTAAAVHESPMGTAQHFQPRAALKPGEHRRKREPLLALDKYDQRAKLTDELETLAAEADALRGDESKALDLARLEGRYEAKLEAVNALGGIIPKEAERQPEARAADPVVSVEQEPCAMPGRKMGAAVKALFDAIPEPLRKEAEAIVESDKPDMVKCNLLRGLVKK